MKEGGEKRDERGEEKEKKGWRRRDVLELKIVLIRMAAL